MVSARNKKIFDLGLPIMGGMVSQNVMNLVDTAMVGSLGKVSLAAVGMSSYAAFVAQAAIMGLAPGVQALAARRYGSGDHSEAAIPLNAGLVCAITIGLPVSVLLFWFAPQIYPYLNADPQVVAEGVPYLKARLVAVIAVGMNFAFRGYFNGVNQSRIYMRSLMVMHFCNLILNYGLIFGNLGMPRLGSLGAGMGTAIATFIGTATYFIMAWSHARETGFLRRFPSRETFRSLLSLGIPSGLRQLLFALGLATLFWIVGKISTTSLAAANVVVQLMLVAILPGLGLGIAAASLVGQALGRGDATDAKRWGWDVVKIAVVILGSIGLPMLLIPEQLLMIFTRDRETIEVASLPLRLVGATIALDGIGLVLQNAMVGAGDARRVAYVAVFLQWALFLPLAYLLGPHWGYGFLAVWLVQIGHRILQAACFGAMWHRGHWAHIKI